MQPEFSISVVEAGKNQTRLELLTGNAFRVTAYLTDLQLAFLTSQMLGIVKARAEHNAFKAAGQAHDLLKAVKKLLDDEEAPT